MSTFDAGRRRFLRVSLTASGALLFGIGDAAAEQFPEDFPAELLGDDLTDLGPFLRIERDGRVVIGAPGCEVGQGAITTLPMLIAEELGIGWQQVRIIQLPYGYSERNGQADNRYGNQGGDAERFVALLHDDLRRAGALARRQLVQAAASEWSLDPATLRTESGFVIAPDNRRLNYGSLARRAARINVPADSVALKNADQWSIVGKPARVIDGFNVVTGRARFGSDHRRAKLAYAVVLRCPWPDGVLESLDEAPARAIAGVTGIVPIHADPMEQPIRGALRNGVAIIARSSWIALKARAALEPEWTPGPWATQSTADLRGVTHLTLNDEAGSVVRSDGDLDSLRRITARIVEARYELPMLAHATAEPPSALIHIRKDGALLIASIENPDAASERIAAATGLPRSAIEIRLPRSGGSFGRRLRHDFIDEAIQIGKTVDGPVKLLWTRSDDLRNDYYRPFGIHRMLARLDRKGRILGWSQRCAATARGWRDPTFEGRPEWAGVLSKDSFPAGLVAHFERRFHAIEFGHPRGDHRGREHTFTAFAEQCFIDEIAVATKRDAVAMRLELLGEPRRIPFEGAPDFDTGRMAAVLRRCAQRMRWGQPRNDGRGLGIACHYVDGAYVAHAFEVGIDNGELVVHRALCIADVGRVANPLAVERHLAAATTSALATALHSEITIRHGQVRQKDFSDYIVNAGAQTPRELVVERIESTEPPVPTYSAGYPGAAPALANAIFAATTVRIRKLPMLPELRRML